MSTSSTSKSSPQHRNALSPYRRFLNRLASKKLSILYLFVIPVLGCANLAAFSVVWNIPVTPLPNDPDLIQVNPGSLDSTDVLTIGQSGQNFALSTQLLSNDLPEPTRPLEPTPSATSVISYLPTATETPTIPPSPTAPSQPAVTETPIVVPELPATIEVAQPAPILEPAAIADNEIKHVIIISIDGLRPDALFLAGTPNLDKLIEKGSYCPHAQTVSLSITLPSHASMLSGMTPEKHGILWGLPYIGWPGMEGPTLFTVAQDAGLSTGMIFGKEKLNYIAIGNSVDNLFGIDTHDPEIKDKAIEFIQAGLPNVLFIHFPDTDRVGHAYGWMSENQLFAITFVDGLIGEILVELEKERYIEQTLLIVTSDHGGRGLVHGDDSPEDRTIPWLAVGPGVPAGVTLSGHLTTYDTAATAAHALGLSIPEKWDGRPVMEIFQQ